mgnify:FL=1
MSNKGKRYTSQKPKLNIKKVIAVLFVFAVIIMAITGVIKLFNGSGNNDDKTVPNRYFAVYTDDKWGVINSKGETIIKPEYTEAIIIPDNSKDLFLCTYDVNYTDNTYKTKVINSKNEEIITGYYAVMALENYDSDNNVWYENDVLLSLKDGKYGFVNKAGIVVVDYIYDDAREQNEYGFASVKKNGMWGCVNSKGKQVMTPAYQLESNSLIEFINKWHLGEDLNLNYYTDK